MLSPTKEEGVTADYLARIAMKWLLVECRERLQAPLLPAEIVAALKDMSGGKVPGTDGLAEAFYKAYLDVHVPQLITLYEELVEDECMPHSMQ
ncbi:hypothetical protein NDU88_002549 [Pleurodeles waltl]|uniref:Uncharacterized protein n=1 Tax=Pleurodeles waltl TaxID=8319 RepID=A0AAV7RAB0_PLEWA|nr:hypothetical protein NDU88_002549 [Pleurodeles waltl]